VVVVEDVELKKELERRKREQEVNERRIGELKEEQEKLERELREEREKQGKDKKS